MAYHLFKQSRIYEGRPYCGPTSNNVPASFATFDGAFSAKRIFTEKNPVGWDIYDADTQKLVGFLA